VSLKVTLQAISDFMVFCENSKRKKKKEKRKKKKE
jgi:hypothetical protein